MRVLLLSPKMLSSFWSLEQSLAMVGRKALMPPLGLITVAALLPNEWELRLVDRNFQRVRESLWDWADIVMISGMFAQKEDMLSLIRESKKRGKRVVVGGPYVSSVPDDAIEVGADFIVKGEAETTVPALLTALADGAPGGVFEEQGKPDLTDTPVPRYDLVEMSAYNSMPVQTSRGCPFDCEFCDIIRLYGRKPRYKKPDKVIAELQTIYDLGWAGGVFICDDNFIGNKSHAKAILRKLTPWMEARGEPFGFWTQTSINLGQDLEMMDLMTEANFGHVFIGIESPDENVLTLNRKLQNISTPMVQSLHAINSNGLSVMGSLILGFDAEEKGVNDRICAFIESTNLPAVMVNTLQAAPNTRLFDRLQQENRLRMETSDGVGSKGVLNFVPTRPETEIMAEWADTIQRLYEPSAYFRRAYNYYLTMRPTRKALAGSRGEKSPKPAKPIARAGRKVIKDRRMRPALKLIWRQGVVSPHRSQFWRQLVGIMRKNPSRLATYVLALGLGENLFQIRKDVRRMMEKGSAC